MGEKWCIIMSKSCCVSMVALPQKLSQFPSSYRTLQELDFWLGTLLLGLLKRDTGFSGILYFSFHSLVAPTPQVISNFIFYML